jgi:peptide/nickel transport system substrate-binding protein
MGLNKSLVIPLALAALLAGCAPASAPGGSAPGAEPAKAGVKRVVAAINSSPKTISSDNLVAGSGTYQGGDSLEELLNGGLTNVDTNGRRLPLLAEAVPSAENGLWQILPNGTMTTTWKIKENARWHDGTPVTATDAVFTAALAQDKDLPVFSSRTWAYVQSIDTPDPRTITLNWKSTYIQADSMFEQLQPAHILQPTYQADKMAILAHPYWNTGFVGTGPFRLKEFAIDSHVAMSANDDFVFGRPKLDEIVVKFIPDVNTMMANLLAGEVELTLGRSISVGQGMELRQKWAGKGDIDIGFSNWIALWNQFLNPNPQVMLNVDFRRALVHSLNRQEMADVLMLGVTPVAETFVSPTEAVYKDIEPQIVKYPYDLRRSAQLIEGLGYTKGSDGLYRDAAGQTIPLEVRTSGGDDAQEAGILSVSDYFRRAGIASDPFLIPQAQRDDREFGATFPGTRLWRQNNSIYDLDRYTSAQATLPENRFSGSNRGRYMNPELDALIGKYQITVSEKDRVPLLGQIVHHMTDQVTIIDLWYNAEVIAVSSRLRNVGNKKTGEANQGWNAYTWDVV